mmetsp:Transcript_35558/g.98428  ORF Transcript_35558/g.98428 Transcript_35558/m.98428 type:complete len:239 (+) Transcript_35558:48-764(+)
MGCADASTHGHLQDGGDRGVPHGNKNHHLVVSNSAHGKRKVGEMDALLVTAAHLEGPLWKFLQLLKRLVRCIYEGKDAVHIDGGLRSLTRLHEADVRLVLVVRGPAPGDAPAVAAHDGIVVPADAPRHLRQDFRQQLWTLKELARPGLNVLYPLGDHLLDLLFGTQLGVGILAARVGPPATALVCAPVFLLRLAKERGEQVLGAHAASVGACSVLDHRAASTHVPGQGWRKKGQLSLT